MAARSGELPAWVNLGLLPLLNLAWTSCSTTPRCSRRAIPDGVQLPRRAPGRLEPEGECCRHRYHGDRRRREPVDGTDYTVIASGLAEAIEPIVLQDDNSTPTAGIAPCARSTARRRALGGHLHYRAGRGSRDHDAGARQRGVRGRRRIHRGAGRRLPGAGDARCTETVVIDSGTLTLSSGQVRTTIAVDAVGGGAPFDLLVLDDLN